MPEASKGAQSRSDGQGVRRSGSAGSWNLNSPPSSGSHPLITLSRQSNLEAAFSCGDFPRLRQKSVPRLSILIKIVPTLVSDSPTFEISHHSTVTCRTRTYA